MKKKNIKEKIEKAFYRFYVFFAQRFSMDWWKDQSFIWCTAFVNHLMQEDPNLTEDDAFEIACKKCKNVDKLITYHTHLGESHHE